MEKTWVQAPPAKGDIPNAYNGVWLEEGEKVRWKIAYNRGGVGNQYVYGYDIVGKAKDKND